MKSVNIISLLITSIIALLASGCVNNSSRLELLNGIKAINERCPIYNETGTLTHVDVQDNLITFNYTINKQTGYDIGKMKGNEGLFSELFVQNLVSNRLLHQDEFTNLVITSGYGLQVNYRDADSREEVQFTVSNDEIKLAKQSPADTERILELGIKATRLQLPTVVDEATTFADIELTSERLTYFYDIDEEQVDINLLKAAVDEIRKVTEQDLRSNENTVIGLYIKMSRQTGRGLSLVYRGTQSGEEVIIDFSNDELRSIAGDYIINE